MINRDYFGHDIPGYGKVFKKLDAIGYCYKIAGENIGWNNYPDDVATAQIHQMFMDSSGHRANILGKAWDVIGIGAYKGPGGKKMWTVLFADKCGSTAPAAKPKPKPKPTPKPAPRATAKPKPAPTAKPAARPTVAPSPEPSEEPTPDQTPHATDPVPTDPATEPTDEPDPTASEDPPETGPTPTGEVGMRVVDRGAPQGLLDSIVGDVAGFFFGG